MLVVPAFYLDAQVFKPFVQELRSRGFNAALPPVRWAQHSMAWHAAGCRGGRGAGLFKAGIVLGWRLDFSRAAGVRCAGAEVKGIHCSATTYQVR